MLIDNVDILSVDMSDLISCLFVYEVLFLLIVHILDTVTVG